MSSNALQKTQPQQSMATLDARSPKELVSRAADCATELKQVIEQRRLFANIHGKRYVTVEGWTTLAVMMGFLPREVSNGKDAKGTYTAVVELVRMADNVAVSSASAECGRDEPSWKSRSNYALRSMAATRATSKVCRIAFSWVMTLAGYEVTPAEEMFGVVDVKPEPEPDPEPTMTLEEAEAMVIPEGKYEGRTLGEMEDAYLKRLAKRNDKFGAAASFLLMVER